VTLQNTCPDGAFYGGGFGGIDILNHYFDVKPELYSPEYRIGTIKLMPKCKFAGEFFIFFIK
jgi:hypothetical protein